MKIKWSRKIKKASLMLLICCLAVAAVDAQVDVTEVSVTTTTPATPETPAVPETSTTSTLASLRLAQAETGQAATVQPVQVQPVQIEEQTGNDDVNLAADEAEGDVASGADSVQLNVKDADLSAILKLLAEQHKLNIIAGKDLAGRVTADFYGVTVDEALKAILEMNGYAYVREGSFVKVYTHEQLAAMERANAKIVTRVFKLNYVNVDEAKELLRPALSKTAMVSTNSRALEGIPSGGSNVGGDSYSQYDKIVVRDFEENVNECERLLKEIDIRPLQVMVEATILAVTLDDETSVGIDFNVLSGVDFRGISTADFSVTNPNADLTGATTPAGNIPFGRVGTSGFATPGAGLNIGVITNDVSLFVRALETVQDVNVLSNPKIMALNKQRAEVLVGNRLGYRTTTLTQTTAVETVEFLDTGTQLRFRPFISNDGFVRMEIHPEVSTGSISATDLPSQQTTEVTCNIIVRDGHTVVIGGLFEETTRIDKSQVPLLGSLPLVGALFRSDGHQTLRREIVILLTPHILDHDLANAEGQEVLDRMERQTTGLRSAFPFYTREKLTQHHLLEADKFCARYQQNGNADDRAMAIWNLKLARRVAPNNLEVMERLEVMEAEESLQRPQLGNDSILWRRMNSSGMLNNLPALPPATTEDKEPAEDAAAIDSQSKAEVAEAQLGTDATADVAPAIQAVETPQLQTEPADDETMEVKTESLPADDETPEAVEIEIEEVSMDAEDGAEDSTAANGGGNKRHRKPSTYVAINDAPDAGCLDTFAAAGGMVGATDCGRGYMNFSRQRQLQSSIAAGGEKLIFMTRGMLA